MSEKMSGSSISAEEPKKATIEQPETAAHEHRQAYAAH
jgi:hypothetical protein